MNKMTKLSYQIGDTFPDAREGRSGMVTIVEILPAGPCFQLLFRDMAGKSLTPYVTEERLLQITGGGPPVSRDHDEPGEDIEIMEPENLIPADSITAHIHPRSDGSVAIRYYAWADVWDINMELAPSVLRNEVTGCLLFDTWSLRTVAAAAQKITDIIYPYRLSPDTHISVYHFPETRTLSQRIRLKVFGGPAFLPGDDLTRALEASIRAQPCSGSHPCPTKI